MMEKTLRKNIEQAIRFTIRDIDTQYSLSIHAPLLYNTIRAYVTTGGKRLRPLLFLKSYFAYAQKPSRTAYRAAVAFELLHSCSLIHDDIIDKSPRRRNRPSLHIQLDKSIRNKNRTSSSGQDLALIIGDLLYAQGIDAFLSMRTTPHRKHTALKLLLSAATKTCIGEFNELLATTKPLSSLMLNDIYSLYDFKTGMYSFCYPAIIGATLAGGTPREKQKLMDVGITLGRAFQLADDCAEYTNHREITFTDIRQGIPTVPLFCIYQAASTQEKRQIEKIIRKHELTKDDKKKLRGYIQRPAVVRQLQQEKETLLDTAFSSIASLKTKKSLRDFLCALVRTLCN